MLPLLGEYRHAKNWWYWWCWCIPFRDIDADQIILQSELYSACDFIKKRHQHICCLMKFIKFLKTLFFMRNLQWFLLHFRLQLERMNFPRYCVWTGKQRTIMPFILGYFQEKVMTVVSTSFSPATGKDEFPWRTIRPFILGYFQEKVTTKFCGNSSKLYFCAIWILFADFRTNKKFYGKSTFVAFLILDFCHSGKFRKRLMAGA